MNKEIDSYNDGIAYFYKPLAKMNEFGAKINSKRKEDFQSSGSSFFKEETRRVQDYQFAEGLNHQLTLKISIPYKTISSDLKVVIANYLYDLIHYDIDRKRRKVFLYLEGVGNFE